MLSPTMNIAPLPTSLWLLVILIDCMGQSTLGNSGNKALVMLDGTDIPVDMKFAKEFMSHKFKGIGLKYEVGVCIATGHIVWVHGPSQAGKSDITLA
jgi:hypothetical protein